MNDMASLNVDSKLVQQAISQGKKRKNSERDDPDAEAEEATVPKLVSLQTLGSSVTCYLLPWFLG